MIKHLAIQAPIWKDRSVGIATYLLQDCEGIEVEIVYQKTDGDKLYPNSFLISTDKIRCYPKQNLRGVTVYIVPINSMTEIINVPQ